jgi:hypothetical protein
MYELEIYHLEDSEDSLEIIIKESLKILFLADLSDRDIVVRMN